MTFVVTTWNVENFSSASPGFGAKLDHLATVIRSLAPDVLALQDVRDEAAVDQLAQALDYPAAVAGVPDERGARVALLLRHEPLEVHYVEPTAHDRESPIPLHIVTEHNGKRIHLINAHFEAQPVASELVRLRDHVSALLSRGEATIVLGDLHDGAEAATTQILYGPTGNQPRGPGDLVNAHSAFQRGDDHDAQRLFNVTMLAPETDRWSHLAQGQKALVDHVLASADLMPRLHGLRKAPTIEIRNGNTRPPEETTDADTIPDHAPVTASFTL